MPAHFGQHHTIQPPLLCPAQQNRPDSRPHFGHHARSFWTPALHNCFRDPDIMDPMDLDILDTFRAYHFYTSHTSHTSHTLATFRFSGRLTMDFMDNMDPMDCTGKRPLPLFSSAFAGSPILGTGYPSRSRGRSAKMLRLFSYGSL